MSAVNDQVDRPHDVQSGKPPESNKIQYNVLLSPILDDKMQRDIGLEYDRFRRMDFNFSLTFFLEALLTVAFITRGSFASLWWLRPATPFYIGFFLGCVAVAAGYTCVFSRFNTHSFFYGITPLQMFHDWAMKVTASHGHIAENAFILSFTTTLALYMLGRCLVGQCPEGTSMWDKQSCNPSAAINSVPLDLYAVTMFAPLVPQLLFKGANRWAILVSWVICVVFFNASHGVVGASLDAYASINTHFAILIGLSYEFERGLLSRFLANKERDDVNDKRIEAIEQLRPTNGR
jgi:hypothetical protein